MNEGEALGKITIAPDVLETIARLTTLSVPGVASMAPGRIGRGRRGHSGTAIEVRDDTVNVNLFIVVEPGVSMISVSRCIQNEVTRAIEELVGMRVGAVNVHVEDVAFVKPESV